MKDLIAAALKEYNAWPEGSLKRRDARYVLLTLFRQTMNQPDPQYDVDLLNWAKRAAKAERVCWITIVHAPNDHTAYLPVSLEFVDENDQEHIDFAAKFCYDLGVINHLSDIIDCEITVVQSTIAE